MKLFRILLEANGLYWLSDPPKGYVIETNGVVWRWARKSPEGHFGYDEIEPGTLNKDGSIQGHPLKCLAIQAAWDHLEIQESRQRRNTWK